MTASARSTSVPIVYFGNDWFADNRTSSHHVARQLAARTRVLYVECPGLRAPEASSRDAMRVVRKVARAFRPAVEVSEGLTVKTLVQWPAHHSRAVARFNRSWSRVAARWAMRALGPAAPVAWCTVPHVAGFIADLGARAIVYHCIDDYSALPGVDASAVRMMDDRLARTADLVIAASGPVFESRRALNPNTMLVPHGVDFDHFARARREPLPMPSDLAGVAGPIVGFTGLIERWIDVELVGWLAREIPQATFVMVGRVAIPEGRLPSAPNLRWLGPRPYERLPEYGARFDAAIIPYRLNAQVHAANPLKLREYLSMGLPIVAVSTPEIDKFAHVVAIARTREAFRDAVVAALAQPPSAAAVEQRQAVAREGTWSARVDEIWRRLQTILDEKSVGVA
jgi:glycosyltransferase involved in cell wall biosynthesis